MHNRRAPTSLVEFRRHVALVLIAAATIMLRVRRLANIVEVPVATTDTLRRRRHTGDVRPVVKCHKPINKACRRKIATRTHNTNSERTMYRRTADKECRASKRRSPMHNVA